jgi:hypothetical protein
MLADADFDKAHPGYFSSVDTGIVIECGGTSGMRLRAKLTRKLEKDPHTCDVTLTNLAEPTRKLFAQHPLFARLEVGWDYGQGPELRTIFSGDVKWADSNIRGTDWETLVQLADGARAYERARVSKTFGAGTKARDLVAYAAGQMGLAIPANLAKDPRLDTPYNSATTSYGWSRDELTKVLNQFGYSWTIADGQLVALRDDELRLDQAHLVSAAVGMIGSPEFGPPPKEGKKRKAVSPTLKIKMLLRPEIRPGQRLKVESRNANGTYRAEEVQHELDTGGAPWTTEVECKTV